MAKRNLNADWKAWYKEHLITVEECARVIEPGDVIFMGQATTIPYALLNELYAHKEDYHDVTFWYNVMNSPADMIFDHDTKDHFRLLNLFHLPLDRMGLEGYVVDSLGAGYDTYHDCMWENGVNTYAHTFCPPDSEGYCNMGGYGVSFGGKALNDPKGRMKKKIAFIDATGIYPTPGPRDTHYCHVTDFDYIVECNTEMIPLVNPGSTEFDKKIASFILPYIKDGDKVQIGYGGLGNYILSQLDEAPGTFEVFSEVFCDTMVPLVNSGKITKLRASSPSACAEETLQWLATTDKDVALVPRDVCIEPLSTMQQENLVAINATFMVDLLGQACSEAQGLKPYTGMGGSFAYTYGSIRAPGGRSFLCLRSTYTDKDGAVHSNIVPWLPEGSIVTMLKNYVMFVVTEWGLADIYLKPYTDRIKALIKIAHPDFRKALMEQILTTPLIEEYDFEGYDPMEYTAPAVRQPSNYAAIDVTVKQ